MMKFFSTKNMVILILASALFAVSFMCIALLSRKPEQTEGGDNIEIERKYLIDSSSLPEDVIARADKFDLVQTYINYSPEIRVRKVDGVYFYFTMKLPKDTIGLSREEIELRITEAEYDELVKKQVGNTILKIRYQFYESGSLVAMDIYLDKLDGLAVAEVEFESVEQSESYTPPSWFGEEVTSDKRYKNANLAKDGMPQDN